jgi:hypothetical protein
MLPHASTSFFEAVNWWDMKDISCASNVIAVMIASISAIVENPI